jgi:hypothetical protein
VTQRATIHGRTHGSAYGSKKRFVVSPQGVKVVHGRSMNGLHPMRRMAGIGSTERNDGSRRRGGSPEGRAPHPPKFINRLPRRFPPLLQKHLSRDMRARGSGASPFFGPVPSNARVGAGAGMRGLRAFPGAGGEEAARRLQETGKTWNLPDPAHLSKQNKKGPRMRNPCIRSLDTVTLEEALSYLDAANGDELGAAFTLARDRNNLDGSVSVPDETEVHHALFLLRRARGLNAPSFDLMRVQLRRRAAA